MSAWLASASVVLKLSLFMAVGHLALSWSSARITPTRMLRGIVLASYWTRVALAVGFYAASSYHWPVLKSLQMPLGFWSFGLDCPVYHFYGAKIAEAWRYGIDFPNPGLSLEYFLVVGTTYFFLGPHQLYPALLNSLLASANGVLAFAIGRRLGDERSGLTSALLVSFWPSSLLWPTQLLKDPLSWFLIFVSLWLMTQMLSELQIRQRGAGCGKPTSWFEVRGWRFEGKAFSQRWRIGPPRTSNPEPRTRELFSVPLGWAAYLALAGLVLALTRLRSYLGVSFSMAALLALLPLALVRIAQRRWALALHYGAIVVVVVGTTLLARTIDPIKVFMPKRPEVGYCRRGAGYMQRRRFNSASEDFQRAINANPDYRPAYVGLATAMLDLDRADRAIEAYEAYLKREPDFPEGKRKIQEIMGSLKIRAAEELAQASLPPPVQAAAPERPRVVDAGMSPTPDARPAAPAASLPGTPLSPSGLLKDSDLVQGSRLEVRGKDNVSTLANRASSALEPRTSNEGVFHQSAGAAEELAEASLPPPVQAAAPERPRVVDAGMSPTPNRLRKKISGGSGFGVQGSGQKTLSDGDRIRGPQPPTPNPEQPQVFQQPANARPSAPAASLPGTPSAPSPRAPQPSPQTSEIREIAQVHELAKQVYEEVVIAVAPPLRSQEGVIETERRRQQDGSPASVGWLGESMAKIDEQALLSVHEIRPATLGTLRDGFVSTGGYSLMDAWAQVSSVDKMARYLPRALAIGFLAPFPKQWFDTAGSTGIMRAFAAVEMAVVYALLIPMILGVASVLRRRRAEAIFVVCFIAVLATSMSLVVANLGTLFRLRLQFLLPMLVITAVGQPVEFWRRLSPRRLEALRRRLPPVRVGRQESGALARSPALLRDRGMQSE